MTNMATGALVLDHLPTVWGRVIIHLTAYVAPAALLSHSVSNSVSLFFRSGLRGSCCCQQRDELAELRRGCDYTFIYLFIFRTCLLGFPLKSRWLDGWLWSLLSPINLFTQKGEWERASADAETWIFGRRRWKQSVFISVDFKCHSSPLEMKMVCQVFGVLDWRGASRFLKPPLPWQISETPWATMKFTLCRGQNIAFFRWHAASFLSAFVSHLWYELVLWSDICTPDKPKSA